MRLHWDKAEPCPNQECKKPLGSRDVYCLACLQLVPHRALEDSVRKKQRHQQRALRQQAAFLDEFDKHAFELVITSLKKTAKITVSELVDILVHQGFFDRYRHRPDVVLPEDLSTLKHIQWARQRVIGLAKWWEQNEVAFIGTEKTLGHPYLFYLGSKPDAIFDPTMPKKSKAQWSVNKVAKTLRPYPI